MYAFDRPASVGFGSGSSTEVGGVDTPEASSLSDEGAVDAAAVSAIRRSAKELASDEVAELRAVFGAVERGGRSWMILIWVKLGQTGHCLVSVSIAVSKYDPTLSHQSSPFGS